MQAVLFDLDNTLVDRKAAFDRFTERLIDKYMLIDNEEDKRDAKEYIRIADRNGYRSKRELYSELHSYFQWNEGVTAEHLLAYWFSEFFSCTVLMDGALEVLERLKGSGVKLGLITNGSVQSQNSKIDRVGLRSYFDAIVVSDEVQVKKPDPAIFEIALQRLGIEPSAAVYVGDHPVNDILGAKKAGLLPIWLKGAEPWDEGVEPHDMAVEHLSEIFAIINRT